MRYKYTVVREVSQEEDKHGKRVKEGSNRNIKHIRQCFRKAFSDFVWSIPMREKLSDAQVPSFLVFSKVME